MENLSINLANTKAILIGISDYKYLSAIKQAENNIIDFSEMLLNKSILGLPESSVLQISNRRNDEILDLIVEFLEDDENVDVETLIFYYTGHGVREEHSKELYLTGVNSKNNNIRSSAVPFNEIKRLIEASQIQNRIILLDACHSGLAAEDTDMQRLTEEEISIKGSYILCASAADEKAYFNSFDRNTFFTSELLKIAKNGLKLKEPYITLERIFSNLQKGLKQSEPQRKSNLNISDFYFIRNIQYNPLKIIEDQGDELYAEYNFEEARNKYYEVYLENHSVEIYNKIKRCNEGIALSNKIKTDLEKRHIIEPPTNEQKDIVLKKGVEAILETNSSNEELEDKVTEIGIAFATEINETKNAIDILTQSEPEVKANSINSVLDEELLPNAISQEDEGTDSQNISVEIPMLLSTLTQSDNFGSFEVSSSKNEAILEYPLIIEHEPIPTGIAGKELLEENIKRARITMYWAIVVVVILIAVIIAFSYVKF